MPALPFIAAGATILGTGASIYGASKAAGAANHAADQNIALQREIYGKNEGYLSPYITQGQTASSAIGALLGLGGDSAGASKAFQDYLGSTGYNFQLGQGVNAINSQAATRGLLRSGANLSAVSDYGQKMGQSYFGNYLGQVGTIADRGLSAGSALAGVGQNYANAVGQQNTNAADATASAWLAGTSAFSKGLGALGSSLKGFGAPTSSYGSSAGGGFDDFGASGGMGGGVDGLEMLGGF